MAVLPQLKAARDKLEARDLPGAIALYEQVLAEGDRPDVLLTISGDLGTFGHVGPIIQLIGPLYVADRHGPATGMNLLQAYLAVRDVDAAQHILDLLFALKRPELEERLYGFSNAISDLMLAASMSGQTVISPAPAEDGGVSVAPKAAMISISKPLWFYGLEPLADRILPPKDGSTRRIAFAQLALPGGYSDFSRAITFPEDELARLARGLPAWLAETFCYSPVYSSSFSLACWVNTQDNTRLPMLFAEEWTAETLRTVSESTEGGLDYIITGALRHSAGDYELLLRVWEVKKFRERKQFTARWAPASADAELSRLRQNVCHFMEWKPYPAGAALAYAAPSATRAWVESIGASLGLFLADKNIWPKAVLPPLEPLGTQLAQLAPGTEAASLAWITFAQRCRKLELPAPPRPVSLFSSDLVREAEKLAETTP